jgi:hypothetical protein
VVVDREHEQQQGDLGEVVGEVVAGGRDPAQRLGVRFRVLQRLRELACGDVGVLARAGAAVDGRELGFRGRITGVF